MSSSAAMKSKSTMYLNEDHYPTNQGNIVRFLRSLVLSKNSGYPPHLNKSGKSSRVFGRDLKQHLIETRQESKKIFLSAKFWSINHATFHFVFSSADIESLL